MSTKFGLDRVRIERREIPVSEVTLLLDMPPSGNHLFFNSFSNGRVKTKEYQDWIARNGWYVKSQSPRRISGPVTIKIELEDKHPRRDADNTIKPLLDLIADSKHGLHIIDGDHSKVVRKVSAEWTDVKGVRLTIARAA